jgi:hypothetical protein
LRFVDDGIQTRDRLGRWARQDRQVGRQAGRQSKAREDARIA